VCRGAALPLRSAWLDCCQSHAQIVPDLASVRLSGGTGRGCERNYQGLSNRSRRRQRAPRLPAANAGVAANPSEVRDVRVRGRGRGGVVGARAAPLNAVAEGARLESHRAKAAQFEGAVRGADPVSSE